MSNFKGLFHVSLHVNSARESIEFYQKVGLEYMFELREGGEGAEP